jgi:hypothetical protein
VVLSLPGLLPRTHRLISGNLTMELNVQRSLQKSRIVVIGGQNPSWARPSATTHVTNAKVQQKVRLPRRFMMNTPRFALELR